MHNCLMCRFAEFNKDGPITPFDSKNLCWSFVCKNSPYRDAYYQKPKDKTIPMWYSISFAEVWVDGGEVVSRIGCKNYDRKFEVKALLDYNE